MLYYDTYYDTNKKVRLSAHQLKRRGLFNGLIDLQSIGIIQLETGHNIDTDLYVAMDSGVTVAEGQARINYTPVRKKFSESSPGGSLSGKSLKETLITKIDAKREALLRAGIEFIFDGMVHKLQTSREFDLINWLGLVGKVQSLPDGTPVSIQTEADETLVMASENVKVLLGTAISLRSAIMEASWPLKRGIKDALTDDDAFDLYETGIDSVWPSIEPIVI